MKVKKSNYNHINLLFSLIKEAGKAKTFKFGLLIIYNYFLEIISLSLAFKILLNQNFLLNGFISNNNISIYILSIVLILSLRSFSRVITLNFQEKIKCELSNKFKEATLENILNSDYENLRDIGRGALHKILLINISKVILSIDQFLRFINQFICFIAYLIALIILKTYDLKLIALVLIASFISFFIYKPNTWNLGQLINQNTGKLNKIIGNGLVGIKTIKSADSEKWLFNKFKRSNKNYNKVLLENIYRTNLFVCIKDIIVLSVVGLWLILINKNLDILSAATSLLFCYKLSSSASNGIRHWRSCINGLPAYLELKNTNSKIRKNTFAKFTENLEDENFNKLVKNKKYINSIKWKNTNINNIKVPEITLELGKVIVISGISGIGKTKLIETFIGLLDRGNSSWSLRYKNQIINLDKFRLGEVSIRNFIAYSPQEAVLLEASLKENLLLGNILNYSDEKIIDFLKELKLEHLCRRDFGLHKEIDFSINPISGGELQRINILRSWLKDNPIEIYDEPTTYQDDESVKTIIDKIKTRSSRKMILIVSHDFRVINIAAKHIILTV